MSLIRAFIAIEIPPALREQIAVQSLALKKALPVGIRWAAPQNIHLTLKFLGDIAPTSLPNLNHALAAITAQQTTFDISVGGFGVFPSPKSPRILWIGIQPPPDLAHLHRAIETTCARLGYPPEEKPFNPHLTLGRLRDQADMTSLRPALQQIQIGPLGQITVSSLTLFRSDLRPQGPIYAPLAHFPLIHTKPNEVNPESA
jgi:RNA 2',3'-cyclic 3'-phosphodiesterase